MSFLKRREVAYAFFVVPLLTLLFTTYTGLIKTVEVELLSWVLILATFSILIGVVSMFRMHALRISKRAEGWSYSIVLFVAFFTFLAICYLPHDLYFTWFMENIWAVLRLSIKTMGFLVMLFLYRGARARSIEAGIILFVMAVVILGASAIGQAITPWIVPLKVWFEGPPNAGVMRAVTIGTAVGLLTIFVKSLLGIERSYTGEIVQREDE